jgi:hypothetical protein
MKKEKPRQYRGSQGKSPKRIENTWKILQWASYGAIIFVALALLYTVMFL